MNGVDVEPQNSFISVVNKLKINDTKLDTSNAYNDSIPGPETLQKRPKELKLNSKEMLQNLKVKNQIIAITKERKATQLSQTKASYQMNPGTSEAWLERNFRQKCLLVAHSNSEHDHFG